MWIIFELIWFVDLAVLYSVFISHKHSFFRFLLKVPLHASSNAVNLWFRLKWNSIRVQNLLRSILTLIPRMRLFRIKVN